MGGISLSVGMLGMSSTLAASSPLSNGLNLGDESVDFAKKTFNEYSETIYAIKYIYLQSILNYFEILLVVEPVLEWPNPMIYPNLLVE